jgi:hypothetical protein
MDKAGIKKKGKGRNLCRCSSDSFQQLKDAIFDLERENNEISSVELEKTWKK